MTQCIACGSKPLVDVFWLAGGCAIHPRLGYTFKVLLLLDTPHAIMAT